MNDLLTLAATKEWPEALVARYGTVTAMFDHHTQDSGKLSWIISTDDGDLFVKTEGVPGPPPAGIPVPYLDHADRVDLLRNAADLARSCDQRALQPAPERRFASIADIAEAWRLDRRQLHARSPVRY